MVVLHKVDLKTCDLVEVLLIEAFKEETPCIAKDLGLEDEQVGDVGGGDGVGHMGVGDCLSCQAGAVADLRGRPPLAPLTLAA